MNQLSLQEFNYIIESLKINDETSCIEAKYNFKDLEKIGQTISALSNSASYYEKQYAYMIWGVEDKTWKLNTTSFDLRKEKRGSQDLRLALESNLGFCNIIEDFEYIYEGKRLFILKIKSCGNKPVNFKNIPYIKINSHNQPLNKYPDILTKILTKTQDRSGLPCIGSNVSDLDKEAIAFLRDKRKAFSKKEPPKDLVSFLNSLGLLENGIPNNTCILFLGQRERAEKLLPEISKISRRYEDKKNDIVERLPYDEQKSPLIMTLYKIIKEIMRFNTFLKDSDLFRVDIRQYDDKTIEELFVNSLAHRDRTIPLWNEIIQTPEELRFRNPGKFRANLEKVLENNYRPPYLNPTISEFFAKIGLMEKEGGGLKQVYEIQLKKGLSLSKKEEEGFVEFVAYGKVKNIDFAKLVLKKHDIELHDLLLLDKIANSNGIIGQDISFENSNYLKDKGFGEIFGKEPNKKIRLSYKLLDSLDHPGKYIVDKGLKKNEKKKLILQLIEKKGFTTMDYIYRMFSKENKNSLRVLILEMKKEGLIKNRKRGEYVLSGLIITNYN